MGIHSVSITSTCNRPWGSFLFRNGLFANVRMGTVLLIILGCN